jgi:two-component system, OmpR family, sensor histidine kinase SenX3
MVTDDTESVLFGLERAIDALVVRNDEVSRSLSALQTVLDGIPQGIVVVDENGNETFRNDPARAFVGARHGEALVEKAVVEVLAQAMQGLPQRRNLDVFGPPRRMLEITALPLDDSTRTLGAVVVVDDVSERRRLEAVRRDFVANISHELKTPVGALSILAETIGDEDDPNVVQRLAGRMHLEAIRVGRIVDDLLALSRIEAEERPDREPVSVRSVIDDSLDRVGSLAETLSIQIDTSQVGSRHTVRGDRRQLVSAVANLLENACKYSDKGSTVEIVSTSDGQSVQITVCDHGIGIPGRDLERIFERFYRVDRARSRDTGGTGLGLSIVRHVASNHGGEITVTSEEGEGSTFNLRLPAGPGPVAVSDPGQQTA